MGGELLDRLKQRVRFASVHMTHLKRTLHTSWDHIFRAGPATDYSYRKNQGVVDLSAAAVRINNELRHANHSVLAVFHHGCACVVAVSNSCDLVANNSNNTVDHTNLQPFVAEMIPLLNMKLKIALCIGEITPA